MILNITVFMLLTYLFLPSEITSKKIKLPNLSTKTNLTIKQTKQNNNINNKQLNLLMKIGRPIRKWIKSPLPIRLLNYYSRLIRQSNLEKNISIDEFLDIKYGASFTLLSFFLLLYIDDLNFIKILVVVSMILMGFFVPDNVLNQKYEKFQAEISRQLPVVLTSMAVMIDAGSNIVEALDGVTKHQQGALIDIIEDILNYLKVGSTLEESTKSILQKTSQMEIHQFVNVLLQSHEKGAYGLSKLLRQLSDQCWEERKARANTLANKASSKLFIPMLLLVFPAVLVIMVGPIIFSVMDMFK